MPSDVRIVDIRLETEDHLYRSPIKFGGVALDRVTLLHAHVILENRQGQRQTGFGSMPLGNIWAFPTRKMPYEVTLNAMREVAAEIATIYQRSTIWGHPIDITHTLEPEFFVAGEAVTTRCELVESLPALATLVAASPIDAALHDAYGKLHGLNAFQTLSPQFLRHDLGHYLGAEFAGLRLHDYVRTAPQPVLPMYHLVGALDPLTPAEVTQSIGDGLPEHLGEWIATNQLTHLKIKLNGDDLAWDLARVLGIHAVATTTRPGVTFAYSLDFNERCQNVAYLLALLHELQAKSPVAYDWVQYIEQPTARDLRANRDNVMHEAAKLKPVVIDESLLDLESLKISREMGYTGVAFKACKGQSQTLLLAAAAQVYGLFRCVQDLTCPGASLIHSASLAAHIPGVVAIESNGRQYCPGANASWSARFSGVFDITDGLMHTGQLAGLGLGAVPIGV
ncbi:MAG: enolase C-terminal domain-like protein [Fimbriiglobus sp.]